MAPAGRTRDFAVEARHPRKGAASLRRRSEARGYRPRPAVRPCRRACRANWSAGCSGPVLVEHHPEGSVLEAELYVPTRAAGFVRPGTDVLLRYDAFPYQKFGQFKGVVREVALAAVLTSELRGLGGEAQAISNKSEPVYLMRVRLERQSVATSSGELPIKPGMQLSASLIMEHRTLAAWAFGSLPALAK
ncbi:hypothetical protein E1742_05030 [Pseudoduganella plicata]|uniref:AprE-like beta-barrel domain-containing protein n=1 Tax=Pseudoduganella plicata TaxID=321984 RepID=A0ABX5S813_9BURK|nr:hypothetical protein E1742_05030 [Pseudoduganella plicata]